MLSDKKFFKHKKSLLFICNGFSEGFLLPSQLWVNGKAREVSVLLNISVEIMKYRFLGPTPNIQTRISGVKTGKLKV